MRYNRWLWALLAAILLAAPVGLSSYWIKVLSFVFVMGALTQSYNLIVGLTGYPAFGHVVFFGIGAYATAIPMNKLGWSFWLALPLSVLLPMLLAALLGLPLMRLKSSYFSVATLGIMFAARELTINMSGLTGGSQGIVVPAIFGTPRASILSFYYILLVLMVFSSLVIWWIINSRFGYGLAAIRDDEDAARVMGVPTTRYKVVAWVLAAGMAGLAGAFYGGLLGFLEAPNVFKITLASQAFIMMLLGGMGSVTGPIFGAAFLQILTEVVWGSFAEYNLLVLGVLVVLITLFMPSGMVDLFKQYVVRLTTAKGGERA